MAMIKATSPAENRSPMAIAANIAMLIKRADEILLMPGLWIIRQVRRQIHEQKDAPHDCHGKPGQKVIEFFYHDNPSPYIRRIRHPGHLCH